MQKKITQQPDRQKWLGFFLLLIAAGSFCSPPALLAQTPQDKEAQAEVYINQADELYSAGNYQKATENYLLATLNATKKANLSRAYMGLSLCYFYLNETENAKAYILKVLEIEPQKEVSSLFHPQTYVDLFNQVRKDNAERLSLIKTEIPAGEPKAAEQEEPKKAEQPAPVAKAKILKEEGGGHWEVEVHYSTWSIDPIKSLFESSLTRKVTNEIRKNVTNELNSSYGGELVPLSDSQDLTVSSKGSNYGFGIRFYPLGRRGALSIGFSLEKTKIRVDMQGSVTQVYRGSTATVTSTSFGESNPYTGNVNFRWDLFRVWHIVPYFIFGLGFGPLDGRVSYIYTGTYQRGTSQESVQGEETKTFDQLRAEGDVKLDVFLMLQAGLGIKGEIFKGVFILAEAGFWDGIILRGGLGFRF